MKILSSIALSLTLSVSAWAVSGTGTQAGGIEPSCRILLLSHQTKQILSVCSGTLTGPREVTTAGHCILGRSLRYFDYQVDCGYTGFDIHNVKRTTLEGGFTFYSEGPVFKETHSVSAVQIGKEFGTVFKGNDVGKLTLAEASTLTPASIAPTEDIVNLYFNPDGRMRDQVNCMISGFGESNGDIAGKLNYAGLTAGSRLMSVNNKMQFAISSIQPPPAELAEVTALLAQPNYWQDPAYFRKFLEFSSRVALTEMPGDSGSALFCQNDSSAAWRMIGVASSVAMGLSPDDHNQVELQNSFGLPDTEYMPF